ncbi:tuberous sclerosis 1 protein hamartin isoform X2 [Rhodnius prolixus]|uniref:tuberous sclerosis 1 protein hamartin isoform X2 n=1 Tax=Rhodnius prolixus TaxID=13249 RepID=UPI003D18F964
METVLELFNSLESNNPQVAEDAKKQFHEYFNSTKESWLLNGIFEYYISTGSLRSVDIIVGVREPHERHFFDRILESLRGPLKLQALTLLGHVVRKNPTWLYKIANHPLLKELLRLLKTEKEVISLMNALLTVIILLPIIAGLFAPHLVDLFEVFSHLASWNTNNPNKVPEGHLLHLQIGLYVLFNRLYGMYPCNFLSYLKQEYTIKQNIPIFTHTIKPMLDTVKMHPLLVTASPEIEIAPARWKKMEANDVIMECANFSVESTEKSREDCWFRNRGASFRLKGPQKDYAAAMLEATRRASSGKSGPVTMPAVSTYSAELPKDCEIWSPTIFTGASTPPQESTSIPHTPIAQVGSYVVLSSGAYAAQEGNSPPEAAIEATPESTPVKDLRQTQVIRPSSSVARSLTSFVATPVQDGSYQTKESSPAPGPAVSRAQSDSAVTNNTRCVQRVVIDRIQMENTDPPAAKPKSTNSGGYSPGSPLRIIQSAPSPSDRSAAFSSPHLPERTDEDREVECTLTASSTTGTSMVRCGDASSSEVRRSSSEQDFLDETSDSRSCSHGGLHMPDSNSMAQFTNRVRMRFHSQCQQSDTSSPFQLAQIGASSGITTQDEGLFPPAVRRAVSCPEMKKETVTIQDIEAAPTLEEADEDKEGSKEHFPQPEVASSSTQTDELQHYDYEHLFELIFPPWDQIQQRSAPPELTKPPHFGVPFFSPRTALESYIEATIKNLSERKNKPTNEASEIKNLKDQLSLLMLHLQFEKHRREVHAERNRRLLGKSRNNRALEEHNSALRDQVALLQKEIESLHKELDRCKREAKINSDELQKNLNYWQEQSATLQRKFKEAEGKINLLEESLKEEERRTKTIAREYTCSQAAMFELENTLEGAKAAANAGRETRTELAILQHRLTCAGEVETRLRAKIDALTLRAHDTGALESYSSTVSGLLATLNMKGVALEAAEAKANQYQAMISKQEQFNSEHARLIQSIRDDCTKQIEKHEEKCRQLRELNNLSEEKILELNHQLEMMERRMARMKTVASATAANIPQVQDSAVGGSPPLSASLSSGGSPQMQNLQLLVDTTTVTACVPPEDHEDDPPL